MPATFNGDCGADWLDSACDTSRPLATVAVIGSEVDDALCATALEFKRRPAETDAGLGAIAGLGGNSVKSSRKKISQYF